MSQAVPEKQLTQGKPAWTTFITHLDTIMSGMIFGCS